MGSRVVARHHGRFFSLSVSQLALGRNLSLACIVSKKLVPKAVRRNLIKRHCREVIWARIRDRASVPPLALIFHAKSGVADATFIDILGDIGDLFDKISYLRYNISQ